MWLLSSLVVGLSMLSGLSGSQGQEVPSKEGEVCEGMMLPSGTHKCASHLECVHTKGPMIADAPGQCKEPCSHEEIRNEYGECIVHQSTIPEFCATWYDGCNTCQIRGGIAEICTLMYCFSQNPPFCMNYHVKGSNKLLVGDTCYRFCEDGSQVSVNRRDDCPENTECKSVFNENSVSMISYDSCDNRAWTCQLTGH